MVCVVYIPAHRLGQFAARQRDPPSCRRSTGARQAAAWSRQGAGGGGSGRAGVGCGLYRLPQSQRGWGGWSSQLTGRGYWRQAEQEHSKRIVFADRLFSEVSVCQWFKNEVMIKSTMVWDREKTMLVHKHLSDMETYVTFSEPSQMKSNLLRCKFRNYKWNFIKTLTNEQKSLISSAAYCDDWMTSHTHTHIHTVY